MPTCPDLAQLIFPESFGFGVQIRTQRLGFGFRSGRTPRTKVSAVGPTEDGFPARSASCSLRQGAGLCPALSVPLLQRWGVKREDLLRCRDPPSPPSFSSGRSSRGKKLAAGGLGLRAAPQPGGVCPRQGIGPDRPVPFVERPGVSPAGGGLTCREPLSSRPPLTTRGGGVGSLRAPGAAPPRSAPAGPRGP